MTQPTMVVRPLANAPWRFPDRPYGHYSEVYWNRMRAMNVDPAPFAWDEIALRFSAFAPGVSTAIVGTARIENLRRDIELVRRGPLPDQTSAAFRSAFQTHDGGWTGQI